VSKNMNEPSPVNVYLQPNNNVEYGETVAVNGVCYIKTTQPTGTRTNYITGGTGSGDPVLKIHPGACACDSLSSSQLPGVDDTSHVHEDDKIYLNPSSNVQPGDSILFQDRCYTKTGNMGTVTHVLTGDAAQLLI
jgi:hypothetical protein